jgi:hypothetical protein
MRWYYDVRLKWKLLGGFGAVLALMIAVGFVGLADMARQDALLDQMYEQHAPG